MTIESVNFHLEVLNLLTTTSLFTPANAKKGETNGEKGSESFEGSKLNRKMSFQHFFLTHELDFSEISFEKFLQSSENINKI